MSRNFELLQRVAAEQAPAGFQPVVVSPPLRRLRPDPRGFSSEKLVELVQRIFLLSDPKGQRVVVFTGGQKGCGCSSILAAAGAALAAQADRDVCLIDANVQAPGLHLCFNAENVSGLTDALVETRPVRDFVQKVPGGNLWLLPCGSSAARLGAMVVAEKLQMRMAELRREFAYILVDSPPIDDRADALFLGKLADGVVLVLEANVTRRDAARAAKESFEAAQVRLLGVVLNKRTFPVPPWLYQKL